MFNPKDSKNNFSEDTLLKAIKEVQLAKVFEDDNFKIMSMLYRFNKPVRKYTECKAHCVIGTICADANVYICCQSKLKKKFRLGDLNKNTFKEIWKSKKRQEVINNIDVEKCPPCRYNQYNEIIDYLSDRDGRHKNFL